MRSVLSFRRVALTGLAALFIFAGTFMSVPRAHADGGGFDPYRPPPPCGPC